MPSPQARNSASLVANPLPEPPLLAILNEANGSAAYARAVIGGGARWLSLRTPDWDTAQRVSWLTALAPICAAAGAVLSVHADIDAAAETGLSAIHLPRDGDPAAARQRLGGTTLIGLSAHDRAEAASAAQRGADYVTLSPLFESVSKPGYKPALSHETFRAIATALPIPVIALGGIDTAERAAHAVTAGAVGIAVMGALARHADPCAGTENLLAGLRRARGSR